MFYFHPYMCDLPQSCNRCRIHHYLNYCRHHTQRCLNLRVDHHHKYHSNSLVHMLLGTILCNLLILLCLMDNTIHPQSHIDNNHRINYCCHHHNLRESRINHHRTPRNMCLPQWHYLQYNTSPPQLHRKNCIHHCYPCPHLHNQEFQSHSYHHKSHSNHGH